MHDDGLFQKAWYLILLVILSVFYFTQAILEGVWNFIKNPLNK